MTDQRHETRFLEGKDVIYACRSNKWSRWSLELLERAYKADCHLRRTGDSHVIVTNDLKQTATVAGRNSSNGARSRRDVGKVIDAQIEHRLRAMADGSVEVTFEEPAATGRAELDPKYTDVPAGEFECGLCDPPKTYDTPAQLDGHRRKAHVQCEVPTQREDGTIGPCGEWLRSPRAKGGHNGIKHGTGAPWTHKANYKGPKAPAPGSVSELLESATRGARIAGQVMANALAQNGPATNPNGTRRSGPVKTVELPEPVAPPHGELIRIPDSDEGKLRVIARVLGEDPRVAELTKERDEWKARAESAETKIQLMKDQAAQLLGAADL